MKPKLLVKARMNFTAKTAVELSFQAGQMLHLRHEIDPNWLYAFDPKTGKDGYVPRNHFDIIKDTDELDLIDSVIKPKKSYRAVVLHDFTPLDELEMNAKRGDKIVILDDTDPDWILAVHEGRLTSKPQIIPKLYVNTLAVPNLSPTNLPDPYLSSPVSVSTQTPMTPLFDLYTRFNSPHTHSSGASDTLDRTLVRNSDNVESAAPIRELEARVIGFIKRENQDEWIYVLKVQRSNSGIPEIIYRTYKDFFIMQFALVRDHAPDYDNSDRIIPILPGSDPDELLKKKHDDRYDDMVEQRRIQFDIYVQELCDLPASILSHHEVVRFFAFRPDSDGLAQMEHEINPDEYKREFATIPDTLNVADDLEWIGHGKSPRLSLDDQTSADFKAKVEYQEDVHAFKISNLKEITFDEFQLKLLKKFRGLTFEHVEKLFYKDVDGDWITIANSDDFQLAINSSAKRNVHFKLF